MGTFSDLLAEDMSKLGVGVPRHGEEDGTLEQMVAPLLSWDFTRWPGASSSVTNHPGQAVDHSRHKTKHTFGVGVLNGLKSQLWGYGDLKSFPATFPGNIFTMFFLKTKCHVLSVCQIPARDSPSLPRDLLDPSDGLMMSDIVLQSNVCEFCQAVFPGDTTTRGEFLRHLCTHVT